VQRYNQRLSREIIFEVIHKKQWLTEGGRVWGGLNPPSEIPKALQNRDKLNPIVKIVEN